MKLAQNQQKRSRNFDLKAPEICMVIEKAFANFVADPKSNNLAKIATKLPVKEPQPNNQ
jgi:hypothetical protein